MADNVAITAGTGTTVAADDVGGVLHQRVKISVGADGSAADLAFGSAAAASSLPVAQSTEDIARAGIITETAPASDTASSGLNGRLQRVAQRITSLIALVPASLGSKAAASAFAVTDSTEDIARMGIITETAPASDTASSGLNGRLQRLAQRITALITQVDLTTAAITSGAASALPAGTNNIGDVDIATITAGETHIGEVGGKTVVKTLAMSTDTSAYASGDLIADTQQLDAAFRKADGTGMLNTLSIVDQDAQGVALYVMFHYTTTSMGTENSAPNISDANLAAGYQGMVAVSAADYVTVSGAKVACIKNIGLPLRSVSGTDDLYISVLNATGTPTFTATGLNFALGMLLD